MTLVGGIENTSIVSLTTGVSGILPPANGGVANVATANQGYFFSVEVFPNQSNLSTNATPASSAQGLQVFQFVLPFMITVRRITINVTTLLAASTVTMGIYSADGTTKLVDSGTFDSSTTGVKTNTITPVVLPANPYYFAQSASSNATVTVVSSNTFGTFINFLNAQAVKKVGTAANPAIAGVLPASLGAVSAATINYALALFEP